MPTLTGLAALKARILVVLKAAPTWLTGLGIAVAAVIQQAASLLPTGWQDNALQIGGSVAAVIAAAIAIIRRVTPVVEGDVGLLPPDRPADPNVTPDRGDISLLEIIVVAIAVGLVIVVLKVY